MHRREGSQLHFSRAGFTLIELLVTLAVLTIMLTWGVPNFQRLMEQLSIDTGISRLQRAIALTRNTAISQQRRLTLCPSANNKQCSPNWDLPLLILVGNVDGDALEGAEVLKVIAGGDLERVNFRNGYRWLRIGSSGWPRGYNGTFTLCGQKASATLVMSATGRLRVGPPGDCSS
ncbi:GspH/FimT family pseudopilin [Onishia niordana]|uniref:GspH/FimT family pseudopilin n=1 Tax=Onishia niordana TaxID=2508711 RepID=UPI00109F859A|nr:GspH/FimT family pseudopilin [Halomonas niordiana]